jgi:hypothetical protein
MNTATTRKGTSAIILFVIVGCLFAASQAPAAGITGIADENLDEWNAPTWAAFEATGIKQVRHLVSWNVALAGHQSELDEVHRWVNAAHAHGLQILISFNHGPLPCNRSEANCHLPPPPKSSEYLNAVEAFREDFPSIAEYTAWNEPNHHIAPDAHPEESMNPPAELAAAYWVNMNLACHLADHGQPKYGPDCTVAGGDFLEGTDSQGLSAYMQTYRNTLKKSAVSPSVWAIHPYTAANTGSPQVFVEGFLPQTEGKKIWFTEVGGMFCEPNGTKVPGYTGTGHTPQSAEQFQNESANHLLSLISGGGGQVQRTYYYAFSAANGGVAACPLTKSDGTKEYKWDSNLLGAGAVPRRAYRTLFPAATGGSPSGPTEAVGQRWAVRDPATGAQWLYYVNSSGGISQFYWNATSGWGSYTLGGNAAPGATPTVVRDPATGAQWLYYVNSSGGISQFYWNATSGWGSYTL